MPAGDRRPASAGTAEAPVEAAPALPLLHGEPARLAIEEVPGIGRLRARALRKEGLATVADLLARLPRRFIDRSRIVSIAEAPIGEEVTLVGSVRSASRPPPVRRGRRSPPHTVEVEDGSGRLRCVWFQGARYHTFEAGDVIALSGRIEIYRGRRQVSHPEYQHLSDGESAGAGRLHTGTVVPLYGSSAEMKERGLGSRGFRRLMRDALTRSLPSVGTQLPVGGEARQGLIGLGQALRDAHFPADLGAAERARRRLAFEELYLLQRELERRQPPAGRSGRARAIPASRELVPRLLASVPFEPTAGPAARDRRDRRRHGDGPGPCAGSCTATWARARPSSPSAPPWRALESGHQVALMAPTEVLAEQHFHTLRGLASPRPGSRRSPC